MLTDIAEGKATNLIFISIHDKLELHVPDKEIEQDSYKYRDGILYCMSNMTKQQVTLEYLKILYEEELKEKSYFETTVSEVVDRIINRVEK